MKAAQSTNTHQGSYVSIAKVGQLTVTDYIQPFLLKFKGHCTFASFFDFVFGQTAVCGSTCTYILHHFSKYTFSCLVSILAWSHPEVGSSWSSIPALMYIIECSILLVPAPAVGAIRFSSKMLVM